MYNNNNNTSVVLSSFNIIILIYYTTHMTHLYYNHYGSDLYVLKNHGVCSQKYADIYVLKMPLSAQIYPRKNVAIF